MGVTQNVWRVVAACVLGLGVVAPTGVARGAGPEAINLRHTITVGVVERTKDAIVNVSTSAIQLRRIRQRDPFWDMLGGGPTQIAQVPVNSLGTGFIIHPDGYVVTNNHVIDRAREIKVELADGRKFSADLVSADPDADLAVLRIHTDKPLPVLELGESNDLMIGEPAIAVGNPLGYSHSVSTGIVSAIHRDLKGAEEDQRTVLKDLIQTDAAINPGNSGGPLLNAYGQVIGINTAIRGDAQNIGFAIPIDRLRDLIPELMNPAQANKVDVGVRLKEVRHVTPPATVKAEVVMEGKEGKGGGEVVESIDGQKVKNIVDAYAALLRARPEKGVAVKLADGSERRVEVKAAPLPDAVVQAKKQLGLTLEQVTPMLAAKYDLKSETGLLVTEVKRGSVAEKAGVQPGDVVVGLGRYRTNTLQDLAGLLPHVPKGGQVPISVLRGDQLGYGVLKF